jgi:hypothetical protein
MRNFLRISCIMALSLAPIAAEASVARAVSFDEKVVNADSIVLGKCVRTRSEWDPSHRWILTYSTFAVSKTFKGGAGTEVTVVTPGGSVGSLHQHTIGIPQFQPGAENVLFVKQTKLGPSVLYYDQGTYNVNRDGAGQPILSSVATNSVLMDTQSGKAVSQDSEVRSLRDFEGHVAAALHPEAPVSRLGMEPKAQQPAGQAPGILDLLLRHKLLTAIVAAGIALSTWQMWRALQK